MVFLDGVTLDDLGQAAVPTLAKVASHGALGAVAVRGGNADTRSSSIARLGLNSLVRQGKLQVSGPGLPRSASENSGDAPPTPSDAILSDEYLRRALRSAGRNGIVVAVEMRAPTDQTELTPIVIAGPGVARGLLHSSSTHESGVVTPVDVAATLRAMSMSQRDSDPERQALELSVQPSMSSVGNVIQRQQAAMTQQATREPVLRLAILINGLIIFLVCAFLFGERLVRVRSGNEIGAFRHTFMATSRVALLALASWPVSVYLAPIWGRSSHLDALQLRVWSFAVVLALIALALARTNGIRALVCIGYFTLATVTGDLLMNGWLEHRNPLGISPFSGGRFYGIGNDGFTLIAGAAAVIIGTSLEVRPRPTDDSSIRKASSAVPLFVLLWAILVDCSPSLGADLGGVLAICIATLIFMMWSLNTMALPKRVLIGLLPFAVTACIIGVDTLRTSSRQTHIGRFVHQSAHGPSNALDLVERKAYTTLAALNTTQWILLVAPALLALVTVLFLEHCDRPVREFLSPPRYAVRALILVGFFAFIMNDSGPLIVGETLIWLGPLLLLPCIEEDSQSLLKSQPHGRTGY